MDALTDRECQQRWPAAKKPLPVAMASRFLARIVLHAAFGAALLGCTSSTHWELVDVRGHLPDLQFSLVSDSGDSITARSFDGQLVLLVFGFSHCMAECPLTVARLSRVVQTLGPDADRVRILFVTLDPERDLPAVLHRYLVSFAGTHVLGATGDETAILKLTQRYRVAYRPGGAKSAIPHATAVYIFDAHKRARLLWTPQDSDQALAHDLSGLLHES